MKLANGKSYLPVSIEPDNEKTNTDTSLDAVHTVGDSAGMEPSITARFSVPAADATAVGVTLDTRTLSEGVHTVTAGSGAANVAASVVVDNTAPPRFPSGSLQGGRSTRRSRFRLTSSPPT